MFPFLLGLLDIVPLVILIMSRCKKGANAIGMDIICWVHSLSLLIKPIAKLLMFKCLKVSCGYVW